MEGTERLDQPCMMPGGWRGRWIRLRSFRLEDWLYHILSDRTFSPGNDFVPLHWSSLYVTDDGKRCTLPEPTSDAYSRAPLIHVFSFLDDSFSIGIGWPDRWHCILHRPVVHAFIRWYLRQWIFGEWFGLRRVIWYWLLRRRCARWQTVPKA
jgi:hypothetical protein